MSFSSDTKAELIRLPLQRPCCVLTELSALTQTTGSLNLLGAGRFRLTWQVEQAALARRIFRMLKDSLGLSPSLHFVEHSRLGGRRTCVLTVEGEDARRLLVALRMMDPQEGFLRRMTPRPQVTRQCCRRAYLRGAFLGAGSVTNPARGYHLEITTREEGLRDLVERQLAHAGIPARHRERRGVEVVYLKDGQAIADALALMEASGAMLQLENQRITRQMRGAANRALNCDEHNSERQLTAAEAQLTAIRRLNLSALTPALRGMAELRLAHPELSLEQLGALHRPPLQKSAAASRMRRLMQAAAELETENTEQETEST